MYAKALIAVVVTFASTAAHANTIDAGKLQFLGTNSQGVSAFKVTLNTTGITSSPLILENLTLTENGRAESTGMITSPIAVLFLGGAGFTLPPCPCTSLKMLLSFPTTSKFFTFPLANGTLFTTNAKPAFVLLPLHGQKFLSAGETEIIALTSVPEPSSFALLGSGLLIMMASHRFWTQLTLSKQG
jgi:hypothetical protein